jgi:imidazolonepropionase-like amidohydrolase/Tol biopolymer transport system component
MRLLPLVVCVFFISQLASAQTKKGKKSDSKEEKPWDVNTPPGPFKSVNFDLSEGTWMNLDVSPDGNSIVFDLLGDIYSMPISGGDAKLIRGGHPYEVQPRYSPDGKLISFTSDAGGADNIWVMNTDGSNAKQITKEDFRLLNNAVWSADGNYLIARKHFTSTRSAGAGELWMYHVSGGDGIQLTKKKNDQQDLGEPFVSSDGRYVYYSEDVYPGGYFQYNKDPNSQIYIIKRLDRIKGGNDIVVRGPGGAFRPTLSRDGKQLAFVRRVREKTVLFIRDLKSGIDTPIYSELSKDQQEAWAIFGVYTNFNWTPDNKSIIIWAKGKIRKIDVANGNSELIPFKLNSVHKIADALHFKQDVAPDSFTVKTIRNAITSPDGKQLVFNAVGYLWVKDLPNGRPHRITNSSDFEFDPSFSNDGKLLSYVTWNDTAMGKVWTMNWPAGMTSSRVLVSEKGIYRNPKYSPDNTKLIYIKEEGNDHQGFTWSNNPGIYLLDLKTTKSERIAKEGDFPQFSADGQRVLFMTGGYLFGELAKAFKSVDLSGNDELTHYTSKYANQFVLSPDNKWLLFNELFKVYVTPFIQVGNSLDLSHGSAAYPVKQVAKDAGINLHWSADGKKMHWTLGEDYTTVDLSDAFDMSSSTPVEKFEAKSSGIPISLKLASDKPKGLIAYKNARIITMKGDEVIENGTVLVHDNRIESIGTATTVTIPEGTKIIDCKGKTIMPGIVDVHAHLGTFRYGNSPQQQWSYFANLAFGVTTTHDPSSNSEMVFSQGEMVKAGNMVGPRIYSTGIILYGAEGDFKAEINSLDDAKSALRRTKAFGAFSVKSYNQPRRNQRQQVITAARELNMQVVPEGGSHFLHNMTMILDGHTGIEHNIPVHDIYDDVVKLWSSSKSGYTPTLIVSYGAMNGEFYYYDKENVWENERLMNFTPRAIVDSRSRHREKIPDEEYQTGHIRISETCKQLADAGVRVNLGAHGQIQGLGAHWELKMLAAGGMSPMQAIRCATVNGAYYIGMEDEIGSLEKGKLADFIILDKNPLDDIGNIGSISMTVANGRAYDSMTMNEIGLSAKPRMPFYFEMMHGNDDFIWHDETHGFHNHSCGCRK